MKRNKFELAGHLGQTPELINLDSGKKLTVFWVSETSGFYDQENNWKEITQWHKVEAWGKIAERVVDKLNKGDNVFIDGKIKYNLWTDDAGDKKQSTAVVLRSFDLLTARKPKEA